MDRTFKIIINLSMLALAISSALHLILLSSDSETYRLWVLTQITIQIVGIPLLIFVRKFSLIALIVFFVVSIPFVLINATKVNYSHITYNATLFFLYWVVIGSLVYCNRAQYKQVHHAN
ncbi:hypothetical protein CXF83_19535 [Shewanella sp. Choline-02u-19]|nr:hypothetical protein CXF82_18800 [Shewanella sp. GutDb-MelDb]PKH55394.1 hypothetical protein CXF84_17790 [Shewanella sp. Bg11-22]PKI28740.1 hypothetical protein CXF83_19535 [Shewanella sp. Choline-02u-19]